MLAFSCLCVSCRWCLASVPAFGRCKVTTNLPSLQAISDLARPCFRPAVQSDCPNVCARSHAYRRERGTLAFPWARRWRKAPPPFLPPNWKKFATQLGRNFSLVRQHRDPVLCPERSVRSAFRRCDLGCKAPILSTNQPFLYTNSESTSRARNEIVFINTKICCFSLIISSPGLKTG